jgi:hypothetical protein
MFLRELLIPKLLESNLLADHLLKKEKGINKQTNATGVFCLNICYTISMNEHEILINEMIPNLPENIQYAIKNLPWTEKIININKKYLLAMDQLEKFKDISMMVAVGLIPSSGYASAIKDELEVSQELAEDLVFDANTEIFDSLQELAFGNQGYELAHDELLDELHNEGVKILHDDEEHIEEIDSLEKKMSLEEEIGIINEPKKEIPEVSSTPKTSYSEEISDDDLRGISGHRIPNFHELSSETIPKQASTYNQNILENVLLADTLISKGDTLDASPTEGEQVKQDGDFINILRQETEEKPAL